MNKKQRNQHAVKLHKRLSILKESALVTGYSMNQVDFDVANELITQLDNIFAANRPLDK